MTAKPIYKRVLLKASGEALMGSQGFGIDVAVADRIAGDIAAARALGVEVGVVVGGGKLGKRALVAVEHLAGEVDHALPAGAGPQQDGHEHFVGDVRNAGFQGQLAGPAVARQILDARRRNLVRRGRFLQRRFHGPQNRR